MFNTIIILTLVSTEAERILTNADRILRRHWNLYGFQRLGSGYEVITTDGFGNPYGGERELKAYGIALKVPEGMDYRTAMTYLTAGSRQVNCYTEYQFATI